MKITQLQGVTSDAPDTVVLEDGRQAVVQQTVNADVILHVVDTNEEVMLPVTTELNKKGDKYHVKK